MLAWLKNFIKDMFAKRPPYESAFADAKTAEDVCKLIRRWVSERADLTDEWSRPEETWKRGYGDCEDFSVLVVTQCRKLNIAADIYAFWASMEEGHALVVGERWIADMGEYLPCQTFADAKRLVAYRLLVKAEKLWWRKIEPEEMLKKSLIKGKGFGTIGSERLGKR